MMTGEGTVSSSLVEVAEEEEKRALLHHGSQEKGVNTKRPQLLIRNTTSSCVMLA